MTDINKAYNCLGIAWTSFIDNMLSKTPIPTDPEQEVKVDDSANPELGTRLKIFQEERVVAIDYSLLIEKLPDVTIDKQNSKNQLEDAFNSDNVEELLKFLSILLNDYPYFDQTEQVEKDGEKLKPYEVRVFNHPNFKRLSEISSNIRKRLVTIAGVTMYRGEPFSYEKVIKWTCQECATPTYQYLKLGQKSSKKLHRTCNSIIGDHNKAKPDPKAFMCKSRNFIKTEVEEFGNIFTVKIESLLEETPDKQEPIILGLDFRNNLAKEKFFLDIELSEPYKFTGIVKMRDISSRNDKVIKYKPYLEVQFYEKLEPKKFDLQIMDIEKKQIQDFLRQKDSLSVATGMFGTRVIGFSREKMLFILAKLMQERFNKLKKAKPKDYLMHILIVGNYARGKSELAEVYQELCKNAFYIIGSSTTGVGLTGAVIRDELTNKFGIQAGVLARASGDTLIIEEFDKIKDKKEFGVLNEAMSKSEYTVTKGDVHRKFKSYTQVVMIANPIGKNFDEDKSLIGQIDITGDLLSRFSAIGCTLSPKDIAQELEINRILLERQGQKLYDQDQKNAKFIRKCLLIASAQEPKIQTTEVKEYIDNFTKQTFILREQTIGEDRDFYANITPRHRNTLTMLIKAVAMWHLHPVPTKDDMDEAFSIISKFWRDFIDRPKLLSMQEIQSGMSMVEIEEAVKQKISDVSWDVTVEEKVGTKKGKRALTLEYLDQECQSMKKAGQEEMVTYENVIDWMVATLDLNKREAETYIEDLVKSGEIFNPRKGFIAPLG